MRPIQVGFLLPQQGLAGLWAASAQASVGLAAFELNSEGGILGQPIEVITLDTGSSPESCAAAASELIDSCGVSALIGMFPSYGRKAVIRAVGDQVPFFYTPQFEGLETASEVFATGETSRELMAPGIEWLIRRKNVKRFFLCGSDYRWPRVSFEIARELIRSKGGEVVGESYTRMEDDNHDPTLEAIAATRADAVIPHFLGYDAIQFNREFFRAGLANSAIRFASAIDETVIYGIGPDATDNLFVSSGYFSSINIPNNRSFLERYHSHLGSNPPPPNGYGQSCYEGLYALAALADAAGVLDMRRMKRMLGRARQRRSARGTEAMPAVCGHKPTYFAAVNGLEVRVMHDTV